MKPSGFTLVEIVIGTAVFLVVALACYQAYVGLFKLVKANQTKILALNLANEELEIVRNLSYANVGIVDGIPNGKVPHVQNLTRGGVPFVLTTTIRNIDLPFDGTLGNVPNDLSPADNKLVEVLVECADCAGFTPITLSADVAPKGLETASTNGALFVKVFDANGLPIEGATIHIENNKVFPAIKIDDLTNNNGLLQIVDAPPGAEAYEITVTKSGYSTVKTYSSGAPGNPTPVQPHATVAIQQVTQISFAIDRLSQLSFKSLTSTCAPVSDFDFSLISSKMIGVSLPKYSKNLVTDGVGLYSNSAMEWDTYNVANLDTVYDLAGINPLNPVVLNPNTTQSVSLIVVPKNPKSLLITVKDGSTNLPVTNAYVLVTGPSAYSAAKITERGFINQTDWSGGAGQSSFNDQTKYFSNDGGIETSNPVGDLKLSGDAGAYALSGILESSTIDTGSASNFYNLIWSPTNQPAAAGAASVRFQFATNATLTSTTTWDFKGPDGTSDSYYTTSDAVLNSLHNGDRYVRYKVFLASVSSAATPNISDVSFTYTSDCTPPGQVIFSGLVSGTYDVSVGKSGYSTSTASLSVSSNWLEKEMILTP